MSPEECIAALDNALAQAGEDVVLRRVVGAGDNALNEDVVVRARVTPEKPREAATGGLLQWAFSVIISPTQIKEKQWCKGQRPDLASLNPDTRMPVVGDFVVMRGSEHRVTLVNPFIVADELVRVEMQITR